MPIYEYQCSHCGAQFEAIQKVNDTPLTHCEHCGEHAAKRLISAAGFQLKGTGWYVTDFKDKPKPAQAASTNSPANQTEPVASSKETAKKET